MWGRQTVYRKDQGSMPPIAALDKWVMSFNPHYVRLSYDATFVLKIAQSALHFTPWQTCSIKYYLNFPGKHPATLQLMREGTSYKYPPLYVARYSFIQLSKLKQYIYYGENK